MRSRSQSCCTPVACSVSFLAEPAQAIITGMATPTVLERILESTRAEVERRKRELPLERPLALGGGGKASTRRFASALREPTTERAEHVGADARFGCARGGA